MEATGVYWKPVWHILSDGDFTLTLANAAHVKNVPGRKTDVNDATWLADLLAHGLIRSSFVPDEQTQEMRSLLRPRKQLVRERNKHVQRLQKTLEDANIKLDSVISDVMGLSGRAMIEALIAGESDPERLAQLAHRRIKAPPEALREALRGRVTRHHRFLLRLHLQQIDALDAAIGDIAQEVDAHVEPFRTVVQLLTTIPGIDVLSACVILAEIGRDMSRFPTAGHLISWAGLCPRNDESAGKRRSTRMRKGAAWLKHPRPMRLGCRPQKGQLSAGAVPSSARPPWRQKGDRRCRRLDPDRPLPHAWYALSRSRPRSLQPQDQNRTDHATRHPSAKSRLRRPNHPVGCLTGRSLSLFLDSCSKLMPSCKLHVEHEPQSPSPVIRRSTSAAA